MNVAKHRLDPNKPVAGDVVMARYRWSNQDQDNVKDKIRPCVVLKVAKDESSLILVPLSTQPNQKAGDCVEIPPHQAEDAGLEPHKRRWAKVTEVNRIELPNLAIIPLTDQNGRIQWRRGRVSEETLQQIDKEIGFRLQDKSLKGCRVEADAQAQLSLAAVRRISRPKPNLSTPTTTPPSPTRKGVER